MLWLLSSAVLSHSSLFACLLCTTVCYGYPRGAGVLVDIKEVDFGVTAVEPHNLRREKNC